MAHKLAPTLLMQREAAGQARAEGIAAQSWRSMMEAAAAAPMRADRAQKPAGGMFDETVTKQADLFSR
jgi:hypothetical protein